MLKIIKNYIYIGYTNWHMPEAVRNFKQSCVEGKGHRIPERTKCIRLGLELGLYKSTNLFSYSVY